MHEIADIIGEGKTVIGGIEFDIKPDYFRAPCVFRSPLRTSSRG